MKCTNSLWVNYGKYQNKYITQIYCGNFNYIKIKWYKELKRCLICSTIYPDYFPPIIQFYLYAVVEYVSSDGFSACISVDKMDIETVVPFHIHMSGDVAKNPFGHIF